MKTIVPSYYSAFRCIADKCKHSCCVGWEIDVDEATLARYDDPAVPLYAEFQRHIDREDTPHFRLGEGERCPFLRPDGLCKIICTMGEGALCQICADHPRFRHDFSDHTEMGLGLCCEAATELVLFGEEPVTWVELSTNEEAPQPLTQAETLFFARRREVYEILQNRPLPLRERFRRVIPDFDRKNLEKSCADWAELLRNLERLDPAWDAVLDRLASLGDLPLTLPEAATAWDLSLENLAMYLAFRHLADCLWDLPEDTAEAEVAEMLRPRLVFCAFGVALLYRIFTSSEEVTRAEMVEYCRLFSSEIEYSEENVDALLSLFD